MILSMCPSYPARYIYAEVSSKRLPGYLTDDPSENSHRDGMDFTREDTEVEAHDRQGMVRHIFFSQFTADKHVVQALSTLQLIREEDI
jgi:hypothetical protein